ncbi:hypothetical protein J5893_01360 [bacterium]|nr:hypothetical protein [bacterium]
MEKKEELQEKITKYLMQIRATENKFFDCIDQIQKYMERQVEPDEEELLRGIIALLNDEIEHLQGRESELEDKDDLLSQKEEPPIAWLADAKETLKLADKDIQEAETFLKKIEESPIKH